MLRFDRWTCLAVLLLTSSRLQLVAQSPTWSDFTPTGTGPTLNSNPGVYDPASNQLMFFGGVAADGSCCTSDTWALTNANGSGGSPGWQKLAVTGALPPVRISHSAVYDANNNRLIVFAGGQLGCGTYCVLFNDVWVLSNANGTGGTPAWTQLAPTGTLPPGRAAHRAVYDATTNRMVIFGGGDDGTDDRNDTWVLTNANGLGETPQWIQMSPTGSLPTAREDFMVGYDPVANAMTVFGGAFYGDLWILSNANGLGGTPAWQQITQSSPAPGTLANWNYGYDQATNTLIFFGGSPSFDTFRNDVWVLNNANGVGVPTWEQLIPNGAPGSPPATGAFLGAFDSNLKRLMIVPDATDLWVLTTNSNPASISVAANLSAATFAITGPANFSGSGISSTFTNVPAGTYTITFGSVASYVTPPQQTQTLAAGGAITFTGAYSSPALGPGGGTQNPVAMYAEPVDTQSGNYFYQHTDFNIPGRGMALMFSRSYNAQASNLGPLGNNWTHSYNVILNDAGSSISITWGDGHAEIYLLSAGVYYPSPGVHNTLLKNQDGTYAITQKDRTQYNFATNGRLSGVIDKNGNQLLCGYAGNGTLTKITDTVGRTMTFTYDKSNRIVHIVDSIGRKESFTYSANNDLATATDPLKGVTTFSYDTAHHVTTITSPGKILLLTNVYDSSGRVISQTNGNKFTTTFAYGTPAAGQTTITDPLGNTIVHTYDSNLRIVQITDALTGTISYSYDQNNDRTGVTNQNGKTTTFTYDSLGNVIGITDPLGDQTSFSYDAKNDLTSSTNANGESTIFAYDGNGNLTTTEDALSNVTKFGYDSFGELTSKTDANNHTTNYAYDFYGNLTKITDALTDPTTMGYDGIGRLTSVTDANGHTTTSSYDALSHLVGTTDALGDATQFKYSPVGNLEKVTDANNNTTTYAYDAVNNLTGVTNAAKHVTKYSYDANNNRLSFTNAKGKKTVYAYDKLNRLSTTTDPLLYATAYSYDPVGNIASMTDANGHVTQFAYDAANHLTGISYFDGTVLGYAYDPDGNRTGMTDFRGTTAYSYDALDRVSGVAQPDGTTVAYSYDGVGHRSAINYPDGKALSYSYDAANRLSNVTDWLNRTTAYSYDPANRPVGVNYPNTASISFAYDSSNRLTNVSNTYPATAIGSTGQFTSFTYALDKVGTRVSATDGNGTTTSYTYDALYELTSATNVLGSTKYTYDAFGNRLTLSILGGSVTSYKYDADDRLLSAGKTSFTYDKNGNRISQKASGQTLTYVYDAANRLVSVTGGSQPSTFAYDGDGHRVSQTVPSGTYTYVNDLVSLLPTVLQENGPDGFISYAYGLGLISESSSAFAYFYHVDGLGSTVGLTDSTGNLQQGYTYDAWGNIGAPAPNYVGTANKFRYTGQALDPGTGLYFLRARYYDPSGGRFVRRDPFLGIAAAPGTTNRYVYALSNPLRYRDPSGLFSIVGAVESILDFVEILPAANHANQVNQQLSEQCGYTGGDFGNCTSQLQQQAQGPNSAQSKAVQKIANFTLSVPGTIYGGIPVVDDLIWLGNQVKTLFTTPIAQAQELPSVPPPTEGAVPTTESAK